MSHLFYKILLITGMVFLLTSCGKLEEEEITEEYIITDNNTTILMDLEKEAKEAQEEKEDLFSTFYELTEFTDSVEEYGFLCFRNPVTGEEISVYGDKEYFNALYQIKDVCYFVPEVEKGSPETDFAKVKENLEMTYGYYGHEKQAAKIFKKHKINLKAEDLDKSTEEFQTAYTEMLALMTEEEAGLISQLMNQYYSFQNVCKDCVYYSRDGEVLEFQGIEDICLFAQSKEKEKEIAYEKRILNCIRLSGTVNLSQLYVNTDYYLDTNVTISNNMDANYKFICLQRNADTGNMTENVYTAYGHRFLFLNCYNADRIKETVTIPANSILIIKKISDTEVKKEIEDSQKLVLYLSTCQEGEEYSFLSEDGTYSYEFMINDTKEIKDFSFPGAGNTMFSVSAGDILKIYVPEGSDGKAVFWNH